jgi:hypothetical protein
MPTEVKTGVGRIVWGSPAKAQVKKQQEGPQKGQPVLKDGQPVNQWAFGVAFPKAEFQATIWPAMSQEAASGYPNGTPPRFAWKYQDGDGIDSNGQPFSKREGYAGCYVLTISSEAFAPPVYKFENGAYRQLEPHEIKTGDYVAVAVKFVVNVPAQGSTHTPSLYVNPVAIEFVGYGKEIQNGPDPMALFGGQQRQLPPGASSTPIAPANGVSMPGTGPQMMQPQPGQMPGQQPAPQMMQQAPQPGYPQPSPGYNPPHDPRFTGYPQPSPGYNPPHDPRFTGGPQPGQMPMQQPNNNYPPGSAPPPGAPGPQYQQPVQPAHDFVHNAGQQPQQMYQPQPGQMQPAPQMMQQPQPGMMPPNR